MPRITMKDVAEVMGVSQMSVSNAFNRPDQLSAELRERILARAAKMGYSGPDAAARHLRSGRTNTFAVIFQEKLSYAFSDPFSSIWLTAFATVMEQHRASVLMLSVPGGDLEARAAVADTSADGVAGLCPDTPGIQLARERGLPSVVCTLDEQVRTATSDYVVIDDYQAGLDAAGHIRRLGHQDVDVLVVETVAPAAGPTLFSPEEFGRWADEHHSAGHLDSWMRLRGVLDGLAGTNVRLVVTHSNRRDERGAPSAILDRHDRPTAVIALTDATALGLMDACRERGLTPGPDLSVVGFDDLPDSAREGLTTIAQPIAEKGRLAAELLLDRERTDRQIVLPHELVVRASTRPAPLR